MAFSILVNEHFPLEYGLDKRSNSRFSEVGGVKYHLQREK